MKIIMLTTLKTLFSIFLVVCITTVFAQKTVYSKAKYHGKGSVFNPCKKGTFLDVGTGGCYSCPSGFKRTVYPVSSAKACSQTTKITSSSGSNNSGSSRSGYYVAVTAKVKNESHWKVRYKFNYAKNRSSKWFYANPKSTGSGTSSSESIYSVYVEWLDIATWKKLGYTRNRINNYQQRGSASIRVDAAQNSVSFRITGSVLPPKPIKLVE